MSQSYQAHLAQLKELIDAELERALPGGAAEDAAELPVSGEIPTLLRVAMRYSVTAGGKRLRPAMLLAAAEMLDVPRERALPYACAIELIHTYALIHDDLPAMDDDDLRRGRPSNHKVFGEGVAILAGDGLQSLAFEWMLQNALQCEADPRAHMLAMHEIVRGSGVTGMVAGQTLDIAWEGRDKSRAVLDFIHMGKTASLITAPLRAGLRLGGGTDAQLDAITEYGNHIGMVFQITDDILDVTGDAATLGKKAGSDVQQQKLTYPAIYGVAASARLALEHAEKARAALTPFGDRAWFLSALADELPKRKS